MRTDGSESAGIIRRVTLVGVAVNISLALLKFVLGVVGHSQALVADAAHSLSDLGTDLILLLGVRYWTAPADENHPYGHKRLETMVSAAIGLLLAGAAVGIGYRAIASFGDPDRVAPSWIAFIGALLSILFKEGLYRWTVAAGRRVRSPALEANAWHHRTDAVSSLPVALSVVLAIFHPAWGFVDQLAALLVTAFLLNAAWHIFINACAELTDRSAPPGDRQEILRLSQEVDGVREVHALRTRLSGGGTQVDLHVLVDGDLSVRDGHGIAGAVKGRLLDEGPGVLDVVVHIEPFENESSGH